MNAEREAEFKRPGKVWALMREVPIGGPMTKSSMMTEREMPDINLSGLNIREVARETAARVK